MSGYQLSPAAIADFDEILFSRAEHSGDEAAAVLEDELIAAFERLAATPGLGHRRNDLSSRHYYFYTSEPYLIVYTRHTEPLPILGIFHSARDIKKLLRKRS